jgi:Flp pilus assembly protein protease CpaA
MFEIIFLFVLALIWIVFAVVEDLKTREIANWLNFSLIIFALGFRFFYSLFEIGNFQFFYQGLIGLGIFFVLSNLFYYGKMFAGGDSKLMMALGVILPISVNFLFNVKIFILFVFLFLIVGAIYGFINSLYFGIVNFLNLKKEFKVQLKNNKNIFYLLLLFAIVFLVGGFFIKILFYFGLVMFFISYYYIYVKSVDEACMVRKIKTSKLTLGDWLYKDVKIGKKIVKATWDGLSEKDIKLLRRREYVVVRYGIQFAPVFLISFILLGLILKFNWFGAFIGLF